MSRILGYHLVTLVDVDRPELRDVTFKLRSPYKVEQRRFCATWSALMSERAEILRGGDDFVSEYVSEVGVREVTLYAEETRTLGRTVRRWRDGERIVSDHTSEDDAALQAFAPVEAPPEPVKRRSARRARTNA